MRQNASRCEFLFGFFTSHDSALWCRVSFYGFFGVVWVEEVAQGLELHPFGGALFVPSVRLMSSNWMSCAPAWRSHFASAGGDGIAWTLRIFA